MSTGFLWHLVRSYRSGLLLLMLVNLGQSVIVLLIPWLAGLLGGVFLGEDRDIAPILLGSAIIGLLGISAVLQIIAAIVNARVTQDVLAASRRQAFGQLLGLPVPWHQSRNRGDLMAILTVEIDRLGHFISGTLVSIPTMLLTAVGATVLMLRIDPVLSLLIPVLVPAFFVVMRLVGRRLRGLGLRIQEAEASMVAMIEEMLDLLPALKAFTAEAVERRRFADAVAGLRGLTLKEARIYAILDPVIQFGVGVATVVLLFVAGTAFKAGQLSAAETISFLMYVALLVRPVSELATVYGQVQSARGSLARIESLLQEAIEGPMADAAPPHRNGDIIYEGVSFAYPDRGVAIHDLTLHIRPGETVAITGPNGAGKSTMIGLLLGFLRPQTGRLLLDNQDIATIPVNHLRGAIGYVPQIRHLRNASVAENIAFGHDAATRDQIEAAARVAQAHDFVTALPMGYDTLIGDKGVRLSGGQQQRIALARAILRDPPILILDEATSMFDLEGEAAFVAECRVALSGRTVIIISHRPASLALADRILRMENGRLVAMEQSG